MEEERKAKVVVEVPYFVRELASGANEFEIAAGNLADCLRELESRFPRFRGWFVDSEGRRHPHVLVFVNGEVRWSQELLSPLKDGDRIVVVPFVAGGSDY